MTWVGWTYIWTIAALFGMSVRGVVLRGNLRDNRVLRDPRINASRMMRRIAFSQLRLSAVLMFVSGFNFVIGLLGLWEIYTHDFTGTVSKVAGWGLILFLMASEIGFTILAWIDLRIRSGPLE